jgi:hypothetical protein
MWAFLLSKQRKLMKLSALFLALSAVLEASISPMYKLADKLSDKSLALTSSGLNAKVKEKEAAHKASMRDVERAREHLRIAEHKQKNARDDYSVAVDDAVDFECVWGV